MVGKPANLVLYFFCSIYLLTYNVAREDISEDLTNLFDFQRVGVHDMYVITLEEITFSSLYTSDQYMSKLDKIFGERNYVRLKRLRFMITSLSIYVPKDKLHKFHHVKVCSWSGLRLPINESAFSIFLDTLGANGHYVAQRWHWDSSVLREYVDGLYWSSSGPSS